jgi:hypothetical protein
MARSHKVLKFFSPKKLMIWRDMKGRTKEIHKELQDLDPLCFPHLEERWIGGNIDLDLLSLFHQRYERTMGGIERGESFPRSTMEGIERRDNKLLKEEEEDVYLYPLP